MAHRLRRNLTGRPEHRWALRQLHGEPSPWVDAGPTQEHIAKLTRWGLPENAIASAAGVGHSMVHAHAHRRRPRIYRNYEAAILAVTYLPHPAQDLILNVGCRRRVEALVAQGYPMAWIADQVGAPSKDALRKCLSATPLMQPDRRPAIVELYEQLATTSGPSKRARTLAARAGYVTSWAWDDDTIDDPDARPVDYARTSDVDTKLGVDAEWLMSPEGGSLTVEAVAAKYGVQADSVTVAVGRLRHRRTLATNRKITDEQVAEMRRRHAAGEQVVALAREAGISKGHASGLIRGSTRARAPLDAEEYLPATG